MNAARRLLKIDRTCRVCLQRGDVRGNEAMRCRLYITYWFFRRKLRIAILAFLTYAALC